MRGSSEANRLSSLPHLIRLMKTTIQPQSLWDPHPRYSQGLLVESGKILFIARQTAINSAGTVGLGDIEARTQVVLQTIKAIVEEAGRSLKDLDATTSLRYRQRASQWLLQSPPGIFQRIASDQHDPPGESLARSEHLVEIQAIAALGERLEKTLRPRG